MNLGGRSNPLHLPDPLDHPLRKLGFLHGIDECLTQNTVCHGRSPTDGLPSLIICRLRTIACDLHSLPDLPHDCSWFQDDGSRPPVNAGSPPVVLTADSQAHFVGPLPVAELRRCSVLRRFRSAL